MKLISHYVGCLKITWLQSYRVNDLNCVSVSVGGFTFQPKNEWFSSFAALNDIEIKPSWFI